MVFIKILALLIVLFFLNSVSAQQVSRIGFNITEQRALLELRSSLGISAKDWHKKVNPCLNWTGIECNNGRVVGINLSGIRRNRKANLSRQFSIDTLSSFSSLSKLNSSGFLLQGPIPEWLGQKLNNLEVLDLSSSSISGSIPSSLGSLNKLSSLSLANNSIAGVIPASLGMLSSLSVLDLSHNLLTGQIPTTLSNLENLTSLDLSSNYLSGPIPIGFVSLSHIRYLNLSSNSLSSTIPAQLGELSNLVELDLGYNSLFSLLPEELGGLRSLRKMSVGNNELEGSLSNTLFKNLSGLEYLVVASNNFIGTLPNAVATMSNLTYLDVSSNNLTGTLPSFEIFSNVTMRALSLNFSNNLFYGNVSPEIGQFHTVDLSGNYFEGLAPNHIVISNNCFFGLQDQRDPKICCDFYSNIRVSLNNDTICRLLKTPLLKNPIKRSKKLAYLVIGIFGGLGLIILVVAAILLLLKSCHIVSFRRPVQRGNVERHKFTTDSPSLGLSFTYDQVLKATRNFDDENFIKKGHSGDLYHGMLEDGLSVVVKRADLSKIKNELWMTEIDLYSRVSHPRLVPLIGHCLENESEKILVYQYMLNKDLSNSLYRIKSTDIETGDDEVTSLDWITRLKIAIGAAEVLCFLHHECEPPVVHRDVQASSILLDDDYEVRLGSLSEVCSPGATNVITRLLEMPQTSARRHSGSSSATCAYDVYCFGKILLELITGKLGLSSNSDNINSLHHLEQHILPFIDINEKELILKIIDRSLIIDDDDLLEEIWAVSIVAKSCLNPKVSRRPSMMHVLKALENPFKVVRGENFSSSRQSWTNAFFGSWNRSSSDSSNRDIIIGGLRPLDQRMGSRGSGEKDHSSSHKRSSSDVFPEPVDTEKQED